MNFLFDYEITFTVTPFGIYLFGCVLNLIYLNYMIASDKSGLFKQGLGKYSKVSVLLGFLFIVILSWYWFLKIQIKALKASR